MGVRPWERRAQRSIEAARSARATPGDVAPDDLIDGGAHRLHLDRADCCVAPAAFRVVLPATTGRRYPADLRFCLHHYRKVAVRLWCAHASVYDVENRLVATNPA
jgi:hypothetical protein